MTMMTFRVGSQVLDDDFLPGRILEVDETNEECLVKWRDGPDEPVWESFDNICETDIPDFCTFEEVADCSWWW